MEKVQIEALIEKYRPCTPKIPDKVNTMGTGKNANTNGQKGIEKDKPLHKKAMKASQIKTSQNKGDKTNKGKPDTLLGDPTVNTKVYMLGSNCKVAPFIKGAAPTCNCKLECPFIKGAAPTVKVHLAPFINGATCSIYKESSSNFKFQSKI